jgi:hypothetical protein
MKNDGIECPGCIEKRVQRDRQRRAELKRLAFELVTRPINGITEVERLRLIRREAPRFEPERAYAKHVGDPERGAR